MYDRIAFPTDGSEPAGAALEYALDVAAEHDATLYALNVADTTRDSVTRVGGEVVDALEREGEQVVSTAADRARDRGVDVETDVLQGGPPETIVDYVDTVEADLLVMATHGRSGLKRFLLGSVTEKVVNASSVPVLTVTPESNDRGGYQCRNVLVPTDGAEQEVSAGSALAAATGARLHLLHVIETGGLGIDVRSAMTADQLEERADGILDEASDVAHESAPDEIATAVERGQPFREIRSYADDNDVDLVVLGLRAETDFGVYALGSVSAKLIRTSPVPLLFVGDPEREGADE